ncbi:MAG: hypothetical protein ACOY4H_01250 [Thermodesulfobacteriota bacterium]
MIAAAVFVIAGFFDLLEFTTDFADQHEEYEIYQIVITVMALAVSLGVFPWRSWRDAVRAGEEPERKKQRAVSRLGGNTAAGGNYPDLLLLQEDPQ